MYVEGLGICWQTVVDLLAQQAQLIFPICSSQRTDNQWYTLLLSRLRLSKCRDHNDKYVFFCVLCYATLQIINIG